MALPRREIANRFDYRGHEGALLEAALRAYAAQDGLGAKPCECFPFLEACVAGAGSQTEQATPRLRLLIRAGHPSLGAAPSAYHLGGHVKQQGSVWCGHFPKPVL